MKDPHPSTILLIPDMHQDLRWVRKILEKEAGSSSEIIFLGDYVDSFNEPPAVATANETATFLAELSQRPNVIFLLGNHDIPYLEAIPYLDQDLQPESLRYYCPGFTLDKARDIQARLPMSFWKNSRLLVHRRGFLISHAGIHRRFWNHDLPAPDVLYQLEVESRRALDFLRQPPLHPVEDLAQAPRERLLGGPVSSRFSPRATPTGCTWLDWDSQFSDALPFAQIVGHTSDIKGARQKGRSWCIDGYQTCYAILTADGSLEIRYP